MEIFRFLFFFMTSFFSSYLTLSELLLGGHTSSTGFSGGRNLVSRLPWEDFRRIILPNNLWARSLKIITGCTSMGKAINSCSLNGFLSISVRNSMEHAGEIKGDNTVFWLCLTRVARLWTEADRLMDDSEVASSPTASWNGKKKWYYATAFITRLQSFQLWSLCNWQVYPGHQPLSEGNAFYSQRILF